MTTYPLFNGTSLEDAFIHSNLLTNDYFGLFILGGMFFVSVLTLKNFYSLPRSVVASGFILMVLTFLLRGANVVSNFSFTLVATIVLLSSFFFFMFPD